MFKFIALIIAAKKKDADEFFEIVLQTACIPLCVGFMLFISIQLYSGIFGSFSFLFTAVALAAAITYGFTVFRFVRLLRSVNNEKAVVI